MTGEGVIRMFNKKWIGILSCLLLACATLYAQGVTPSEKAGLLNGDATGQLLVAEQNKYPIPAKVLSFKEQLGLTKAQVRKIEELLQNLPVSAQVKGQEIVEAEEDLSQAFAAGTVNDKVLRMKLEKIGKLRADLRFAHLQVCLKVKQILSANQNERYKELVAVESK
jgi:Spy/CpxP family protein refolding chaperone